MHWCCCRAYVWHKLFECFDWQDGELARQCNEGKWDFKLLEADDTSLIRADVQPWLVRLLIKVRSRASCLCCKA